MRIALLEDDSAQAEMVLRWLEEAEFDCVVYAAGGALIKALQNEMFDLLILDWNLPDVSGEQVLDWTRATLGMQPPIMFITAREREEDICRALERGADDYMSKPVARAPTLARVRALLRRARGAERNDGIDVGGLQLAPAARTVHVAGTPVTLTDKEFDLISFLLKNLGTLFSRKQLLASVWGTNPELSTRTVDVHVSHIRVKLKLYPEQGWRLSSVYSYGYRLEFIGTPSPSA